MHGTISGVPIFSKAPWFGVRAWDLRRRGARSAHQPQDDEDDEEDANATARIISPATGIGPGREGADQQDDEDDEEYQIHGGPRVLRANEVTRRLFPYLPGLFVVRRVRPRRR
jgi:hypothetical protein